MSSTPILIAGYPSTIPVSRELLIPSSTAGINSLGIDPPLFYL